MTRSVPAPADLGIEVLGVPEGSPVELDLRLEAVMEGVLVTGSARAELGGECARCLEPIRDDVEARFQELYVYDDSGHDPDADEDSDVSRLEGDLLDLEPVLRDAVVLALPFQHHPRLTGRSSRSPEAQRREQWLSRSGRCRAATRVTVARSGRPSRRPS
jgi:uncharacterized metal-binding protein YceD (DUF177 family)